MKSKLCILLFVFFVLSNKLYAQQKIDSLLKALDNHKSEDAGKLKLLCLISHEYQYSNPKAGVQIADSVFSLAQKLNNQMEAAYAYQLKGENYNMMGDSNKLALENFNKALNHFEQQNDKKHIAGCLNDIGLAYSNITNYPKALEYYERALSINRQMNNTIDIGINLGNIGEVYSRLSEYSKALNYRYQALSLSEQVGNKRAIANQLGAIAQSYKELGDYPKALEYYHKSLKVDEQLNYLSGTSRTLADIGNLYNLTSDSALSLEYLKKAIQISESLGDKQAIAIQYQNIGLVYRRKNDYTTALKYYRTSLEMAQQTGNLGLQGYCLLNIGVVYHFLENYSLALEYYKRSLSIAEKIQLKSTILLNLNNIGEIYRDAPDSILTNERIDLQNRYTAALDQFNKSLQMATEIKSLPLQRDILNNISATYEKLNNYTQALQTHKKFIAVRDSILNSEKERRLSRLKMQYEFGKKEDSLKLQQQLTDEKLKQQVLLAKQQQQELLLNKNQLDLKNKESDLQRLAYLKTQADLQNEQLQKQQKEKQLALSEQEKKLQQSKVNTLTQQQALSKLKQQQQLLYTIVLFVLLGLAASWLIYSNRLRQHRLKAELEKEKAEQEKKEAAFQRSLADVSLTALRSQMNPHFIFNCLNSIKLYTTQNNTTDASEYLTKFSKLIRLVMENSRSERISLSSELNALKLYMDMEAMRFKQKLQYNIEVEKDVETEYIEIPPLLLQPYVENAIWHGLMHKDGGGRIDVTVAMKNDQSLLQVIITDNGVGRAKAAELKSKTATKHKSYGMKVTSERIALINQIYKAGAEVCIHDLTNNEGQPTGTKVTIQIPV